MKVRSILLITGFSFILFSCTSTKNVAEDNKIPETEISESIEITEENTDIIDEEEVSVAENQEMIEEIDVVEISPEENFILSLDNIILTPEAAPKQITKRKSFSSAFGVKVTDAAGMAVIDYAITAVYPSSKKDGKLVYSTETLLTDENGYCSVKIDNTSFAVNDFVTFYPTPAFETQEVLEAVKAKQVQVELKIKSDVLNTGAVLFVWDFSERNKPVNNSTQILSEFRNRGMTLVGNAPINETSYIDKSLKTIYKANYEIIGDSYGYLVCGTVKFTKPVEACDDGYLCSLVAEISAVNMKNGETIFSQTFTNEAIGSNWNRATGKCKDELAKQIVDALVFGL